MSAFLKNGCKRKYCITYRLPITKNSKNNNEIFKFGHLHCRTKNQKVVGISTKSWQLAPRGQPWPICPPIYMPLCIIYSSIKIIKWKYIRFFRRSFLRSMERRGGHGPSAPHIYTPLVGNEGR